MKREEVTKHLNILLANRCCDCRYERAGDKVCDEKCVFKQAVNEAIEALSADVVSREEAIQAVDKCRERKNKEIEQLREFYSQKPTIPMFKKSEEAYKAWTGEEMGKTSDEINEMNKAIIKDILKMMPTAYLLEALGVSTFEELTEQADRPTMTEEVRKALMRLTMCAREECDMCKYEHNCSFDKQVEMATESMNTIANAFKSADRPHGEWIVEPFRNNWEFKCSICGWHEYHAYKDTQRHNYCPNCGAKMGGDTK